MLNKFLSQLSRFTYKARYLITGLFIILFITVAILRGQLHIAYSMSDESKINKVFPEDSLVILYNNEDESKIPSLVSDIEAQNGVGSVSTYSTTINKGMTSTELASAMQMDPSFVNVLYYVYTYGFETNDMTLKSFINFIKDDVMTNPSFNQYFDDTTKGTINTYGIMINEISEQYPFSSAELAYLTNMNQNDIDQLFLVASMEQGTTVTKMTLPDFVNLILTNETIRNSLTDTQIQSLQMMQSLCNLVLNNTALSPEALAQALPIQSPTFNSSTINLLYLYHDSQLVDLSNVKIGMEDFLTFLLTDISTNDTFKTNFNDDSLAGLNAAKVQIDKGKEQLVGEHYSRMIVSLTYKPESSEMNKFYDRLQNKLDHTLGNDYYLIGNSAMSYEMSQSFQQNFIFISMLTAVAIFVIIAIAFKKLSIPLILVLLIQSGVYITMTVMLINKVDMYFIALLIVQGLLMGSTIDYGILFTSYYRENRKGLPIQESLNETYKKSIHTILTSAFIMIFVTGILSFTVSKDIAQILTTISIGATSATILILFFLPSLLATFDKFVIEKDN